MLLDELYHFIHSLGVEEQARRKSLPDEFVLCPRCRGYHSEKENQDNLCEKCEQIVHTMEWDKTHGIKVNE